jgi:hypothetical protein
VALQASLAVARNAIIANRCKYGIWVQSVQGPKWGWLIKNPARRRYTDLLSNASTSMKISKTPTIVADKHTQFEYAISNNQIWYDISFVDCAVGCSAANCPGHADGVGVYASNDKCGKIDCNAGS